MFMCGAYQSRWKNSCCFINWYHETEKLFPLQSEGLYRKTTFTGNIAINSCISLRYIFLLKEAESIERGGGHFIVCRSVVSLFGRKTNFKKIILAV